MKSKRSKACDISASVKKKVWERDGKQCIICGNRQAMPNAHFIPRSHGGLGVEQNIVTLCERCHYCFDMTDERDEFRDAIREYLQGKYEKWNESELIYKRWDFGV